jgi:outer membrane lipoprotein-sorting protein
MPQSARHWQMREDLSLSGDLQVRNLFREDGFLHIAVVQTDNPAAGAVELVFSEIPFELNRWKVTDAQGVTTEVMLKNIHKDVVFGDDVVFGYHDPKGRKKFNN